MAQDGPEGHQGQVGRPLMGLTSPLLFCVGALFRGRSVPDGFCDD